MEVGAEPCSEGTKLRRVMQPMCASFGPGYKPFTFLTLSDKTGADSLKFHERDSASAPPRVRRRQRFSGIIPRCPAEIRERASERSSARPVASEMERSPCMLFVFFFDKHRRRQRGSTVTSLEMNIDKGDLPLGLITFCSKLPHALSVPVQHTPRRGLDS